MDNKEFTQPEESPVPQGLDPALEIPEAAEETAPVIEELSFTPQPESEPESPVSEDAPEEEAALVVEEEASEDIFQGLPLFQSISPEELPEEATEAVPADAAGSLDHELLESPQVGQELQADDHAMNYHGILTHEEHAAPFDMDRLEALELDAQPEEELTAEAEEEALPEESREESLLELPPEEPADKDYQDNSQDFQEIFEAPAPKPQSPARQRPTRKGRPKRKKGEGLLGIPNILATVVWLALILAIGVTAGRMLWVCAADVLAFGRESKQVTITIYEADDMASITDKLYDAGLIRYKGLFNLYASISDAEEDIKPGIYDLNTLYDYHALVNFMSPRSSREVIELTIPEGYNCRQIFALLEENRVCTAIDAAAYAANGELNDYWFLEGVERGTENCLEGFLFPDTYEFYKNSTPREALQRMLNNFENRFDEELRTQIDALNARFPDASYGIREIVIVASLIEKESANPSESAKVAGVIYNRLHNWGSTPAYLNIDAAMVYALGKNDITAEDLKIDHPYNTYLHTGLTPGPIANPGLASLKAAVSPEKHGYFYYVLNPATGLHQFSATIDEHNRWINQFYG